MEIPGGGLSAPFQQSTIHPLLDIWLLPWKTLTLRSASALLLGSASIPTRHQSLRWSKP
jgi:hypothetical protein